MVVVGAGIAGCSAAARLAQEGRRVLVLERDVRPQDRIVGELLQPGGFQKLQALGLGGCVEGIDAQPICGYAIFRDGEDFSVKYPVAEGLTGHSFHHGRFLQQLRWAAHRAGAVLRERSVVGLLDPKGRRWKDGMTVGGVQCRRPGRGEGSEPGEIETVAAPLTLVCDGIDSQLRGRMVTPDIKSPSTFVGLILRDCPLPHPNHGHVVLIDPSPVLLYPISSNSVRCLVDVKGAAALTASKGGLEAHLRNHVCPQLPESLQGPFLNSLKQGRIRSMTNKLMPAEPVRHAGALLLGDSFNMRHPLTGGGMTVALHDTKLLCDMLKPLVDFHDPVLTSQKTQAFHTARKPWAGTINTLANALYAVFCRTGKKWQDAMQIACFDYLRKGGWYAAGPISLLAGINPSPFVLVMHFFMVALYGVGRVLMPLPTPGAFILALQLLWGALGIIVPIVRGEGFVRVFLPFLAPDPKIRGQGLTLQALAPAGVLLVVLGAVALKHADLLPAAGERA